MAFAVRDEEGYTHMRFLREPLQDAAVQSWEPEPVEVNQPASIEFEALVTATEVCHGSADRIQVAISNDAIGPLFKPTRLELVVPVGSFKLHDKLRLVIEVPQPASGGSK